MSEKTDRVVRARQAYDLDHAKVGAWIDAEDTLTDEEFAEYMTDYFDSLGQVYPHQRHLTHSTQK